MRLCAIAAAAYWACLQFVYPGYFHPLYPHHDDFYFPPGLSFDGKSSAGIQYDNYDFLLQHAREFIASGKSFSGIRVYMSVGAEEEFEPGLEQWHLTSSFYRMAALMKAAAIPGLKLTTESFPRETHSTVWPMAFIHGIQVVFGTGAQNAEANAR